VHDFDGFVRAAWRPLLRSAVLLTNDTHAGEDLVQETLTRVADRWPRLTSGGADPMPYARTVLYRLAVDAWRRRSVRPRGVGPGLEDLSSGGRVGPVDGHTLDRLVLQDALARLTPRQRAVLVLRFFEDRTEVQTAEVLGCSPNTVKTQTRHALRRLRELAPELVAEFQPEPEPEPTSVEVS
jgi:RNA polymerase sigma-70 factor (sigma-E family)